VERPQLANDLEIRIECERIVAGNNVLRDSCSLEEEK